jgi:Short C-terminal domain
MGLFRRKDERAIPEPGTPEFDEAVHGSALPDSQSVSMGQTGWTSSSSQSMDLRGTETSKKIRQVLRDHGIDPDNQGQTIDASSVPGLQQSILSILGDVMPIPEAGGLGGGVSPPRQDPLAVVEELARKRDAGEITDAEFEAQKRRVLGE